MEGNVLTVEPQKYAPNDPASRSAAEWGLAALLTGGVLLLAAPPTLILSVELWNSGRGGMPSGDAQINAWLARLGAVVLAAVAASGLHAGWKGVRSATALGQPAGLAVTGLALCVAGAAAALIAAVGLLRTTETLIRTFG